MSNWNKPYGGRDPYKHELDAKHAKKLKAKRRKQDKSIIIVDKKTPIKSLNKLTLKQKLKEAIQNQNYELAANLQYKILAKISKKKPIIKKIPKEPIIDWRKHLPKKKIKQIKQASCDHQIGAINKAANLSQSKQIRKFRKEIKKSITNGRKNKPNN